MVDCSPSPLPRAAPGPSTPEAAIPRHGTARAKRKPAGRGARPAASRRLAEQPLGVGVGDGFAVRRLGVPPRLGRASPRRDVREIGWAAFGELSRDLAGRIAARFRPDVVLGVAKGGVFVGGAVAAALGAEFLAVRVKKRSRDPLRPGRLAASDRLPRLTGKRVLVVDDVAASGETLAKARALARRAGARAVRTAVLVRRPGGARPDWSALETRELVVFGWDYEMERLAGETGV